MRKLATADKIKNKLRKQCSHCGVTRTQCTAAKFIKLLGGVYSPTCLSCLHKNFVTSLVSLLKLITQKSLFIRMARKPDKLLFVKQIKPFEKLTKCL